MTPACVKCMLNDKLITWNQKDVYTKPCYDVKTGVHDIRICQVKIPNTRSLQSTDNFPPVCYIKKLILSPNLYLIHVVILTLSLY